MLEPIQYLLGALSGVLVGFVLALVGGGGSILAVPLMVYLVGVRDPHLAIGTSAIAVAANALTGLAGHARSGAVKWRCARVFALAGIAGAAIGSTLGKLMDGQKLYFSSRSSCSRSVPRCFAGGGKRGNANVSFGRENAGKLVLYGLSTGAFSGFFGIGGGFLIVPGLIAATGMPMISAVGSSLVAVTAVGLTTAANYALSSLVDWPLAIIFIFGGTAGGWAGTRTAHRLGNKRDTLGIVLAVLIFAVAAFMLWKSAITAWA